MYQRFRGCNIDFTLYKTNYYCYYYYYYHYYYLLRPRPTWYGLKQRQIHYFKPCVGVVSTQG